MKMKLKGSVKVTKMRNGDLCVAKQGLMRHGDLRPHFCL